MTSGLLAWKTDVHTEFLYSIKYNWTKTWMFFSVFC